MHETLTIKYHKHFDAVILADWYCCTCIGQMQADSFKSEMTISLLQASEGSSSIASCSFPSEVTIPAHSPGSATTLDVSAGSENSSSPHSSPTNAPSTGFQPPNLKHHGVFVSINIYNLNKRK